MIRKPTILSSLLLLLAAFSCSDDESNIASVEDRVAAATGSLKDDLIAPDNGWKLEYQPTPDAGIFLMLLEFDENGEVNIQSDVADNAGEFYNHTIPYRIDNALGIELIFETFGVFHHLFELDQASFGAEFEFIYKEKDGDNLVFESKTDFSDPTVLVFEPASSSDQNLFTRDIAENLAAFEVEGPQALVPVAPSQQLILEDQNISIFWTLDNSKRNIQIEFVGIGTTQDEIIANNDLFIFEHTTGYSLKNGRLVLQESTSFFLDGKQINLESIALNTFDATGGPSLCSMGLDTTPQYKGNATGLGEVTLQSSLLSGRGLEFQHSVYSINIPFLFDKEGNSLSDTGIINEKFPDASGFIFLYGVELNDPDIPIYSLGLITEDGELYLREFEPTDTEGNFISLILTSDYYYTETPAAGTEQALMEVTDEIFTGNEIYAFDFPQNNVYRLFNPCNGYEIFLVN